MVNVRLLPTDIAYLLNKIPSNESQNQLQNVIVCEDEEIKYLVCKEGMKSVVPCNQALPELNLCKLLFYNKLS